MDTLEQVAVPLEERAVHSRRAGQGRDGDVGVAPQHRAQRLEHALTAADRVSPPPVNGLGPVVGCRERGQTFSVAEEIREVCLQVREVRRVGAEVIAADAAEADGAGVPAGRDVRGLDADAVGGLDLADGPAGILVVQKFFCLPPDAVAVPVELQRGDPVDGIAFALLTD